MSTEPETLVFIDTETTGINPLRHEVIELGGLWAKQSLDENSKIVLEPFDSLEVKLIPERLEDADPMALKINGYTEEKWRKAKPKKEVFEELVARMTVFKNNEQKINRIILVGHNVHFDISFLLEEFRRAGVYFPLNKRAIDTYSAARARLFDIRPEGGYSLGALCEYYGITNEEAHTAMSDVYATYELYKKIFNAKEIAQT